MKSYSNISKKKESESYGQASERDSKVYGQASKRPFTLHNSPKQNDLIIQMFLDSPNQ